MKSCFFISALVACLTWSYSVKGANIVNVTPSNMDGWAFYTSDENGDPAAFGTAEMVTGPGTPPLGTGSAHLATAAGHGDGSAQIRNTDYNGVTLSSLTALSYSTYMIANNGQQFPYIELNVNWSGDAGGAVDDILFFEPPYQTHATGNPSLPDQGATQLNTWQTWDALAGGWWSDSQGNAGTNVESLSDYIALHPAAIIRNSASGLGGVRLTVGFASAGDNFDGYVDNFTIGDAVTTFNFDPNSPVAVPVPASAWGGFALMTLLAVLRMRRRAQTAS